MRRRLGLHVSQSHEPHVWLATSWSWWSLRVKVASPQWNTLLVPVCAVLRPFTASHGSVCGPLLFPRRGYGELGCAGPGRCAAPRVFLIRLCFAFLVKLCVAVSNPMIRTGEKISSVFRGCPCRSKSNGKSSLGPCSMSSSSPAASSYSSFRPSVTTSIKSAHVP